MGGGLLFITVNNVIDLLYGGWCFVLINCDLMADSPLPEFIEGVLAIV